MHLAENYIHGQWVKDHTLAMRGDSFNPATGEKAAQFVAASVQEVEAAIACARHAFEHTTWAQQPKLRSDVLRVFADRLEQNKAQVVQTLVQLNGKLQREAEGEVMASISELRYYAGLARNLFGRVIEMEPEVYSHIEREAIGVAAIIVPWNAPVTLLVRSLAPALAAGCTVVIKAAHQTALVHTQVMACLVADERIPAGVINSFIEQDIVATQHLCAHPEVDVISFTGSTHVGKQIALSTAKNLTRLSLELGGKAPAIVRADADLSATVRGIVGGACVMAGQMCTAISRVLVHESVAADFSAQLARALAQVKVGPGDQPSSGMGPLIDQRNQTRLLEEVRAASQDCRVLLAGRVPDDTPRGGAFITPSLVATQDLNSHFVQDEIFGPLITLETFTTDDEAVLRANATRYGLASSVWTQDHRAARKIARRIKFGNVWVNAHNRLFAEIETGGYRQSGFGRLHGVEGLNDFMETKHVFMPCND
ncbi:aldehyde dehydrogenase [Limnohabitans sp. MMS-10A-160]|uniref:aldehyde dehydrogenase family protein n=1 Tax=unclassified Limnohabitans TaxID=2626134 RepID=UPI000D34A246|nr:MULTISPECIES: aldehyde dehydrogenase family protein [unclassified Limnohabitans]PUE19168.1 aldehyde dehydrogenase [Limnohabitans sp. MMS-10A-192]PUE24225.1 aldehyde dehydrogenase [Limnohabitans sp. MMS-10A-160]